MSALYAEEDPHRGMVVCHICVAEIPDRNIVQRISIAQLATPNLNTVHQPSSEPTRQRHSRLRLPKQFPNHIPKPYLLCDCGKYAYCIVAFDQW